MFEDEYKKIVRHARKKARLGRNPSCAVCGVSDIRTLQTPGGKILCQECRLVAQGKRPVEKHHPAGRHNDPLAFEAFGNEHAIFGDMQLDWRDETRMNPKKRRHLKIAALHKADADIHRRLAEIEDENAADYEILVELCRREIGEDWERKYEELRMEMQR